MVENGDSWMPGFFRRGERPRRSSAIAIAHATAMRPASKTRSQCEPVGTSPLRVGRRCAAPAKPPLASAEPRCAGA